MLLLSTCVGAQQLPIWNALTPYIANPYDGDTVDGKYAAMPYVDIRKWPTGVLKYNALQDLTTEDHYTLYVHARVPSGVGFYVTAMTDTSNFGVLYTYQPQWSDNQFGTKDTVLTVDVPAGHYRYSKPSFYRFAIIRFWTQRQSNDTMLIDALSLKVHPAIDTVREDTIVAPRDTVRLSVAPSREVREGSGARYDILGRRADRYTRIWFEQDSTGRYRLKRK